jgi:glutamine synthetase
MVLPAARRCRARLISGQTRIARGGDPELRRRIPYRFYGENDPDATLRLDYYAAPGPWASTPRALVLCDCVDLTAC